MAFLELAKERFSVREFDPRPVEAGKLSAILEAGRVAPTACNNQPVRVKVADGAKDLAKVDECTPCRYGAPTVLLVCYDKNTCWENPFGGNSGQVDASIVTTHLMMEAQEQGLGSCWVMYFDPTKAAELFELPANIVPVAMLPIGYAATGCQPADRHGERRGVGEMLL
jgi:nitroreductase